MVADIEALGEGKIIFASNTSSLPIHKIAEKHNIQKNNWAALF